MIRALVLVASLAAALVAGSASAKAPAVVRYSATLSATIDEQLQYTHVEQRECQILVTGSASHRVVVRTTRPTTFAIRRGAAALRLRHVVASVSAGGSELTRPTDCSQPGSGSVGDCFPQRVTTRGATLRVLFDRTTISFGTARAWPAEFGCGRTTEAAGLDGVPSPTAVAKLFRPGLVRLTVTGGADRTRTLPGPDAVRVTARIRWTLVLRRVAH